MNPGIQLIMFDSWSQAEHSMRPCSALLAKSWTVELKQNKNPQELFRRNLFCAGEFDSDTSVAISS